MFMKLLTKTGRNYEDIATTYRLPARCRLVASVEGCLYHHVKRSGSITQTRSLANLGEYWASSRERYEFCMGGDSRYGEDAGLGDGERAGLGCGEHIGSRCGEESSSRHRERSDSGRCESIEPHARRSMAGAASVVWRWAFGNGLAGLRANRGLLEEVAGFARRELPPLGEPGWPAPVRFGAVLARVGGPVSLAVCYGANRAAVAVADALGLG